MALKPKNAFSKYEIIAHRGFGAMYPENTIASAKEALRLKTPLEFDVQFTADGVMVVIHDDTVDRTTNGHGRVSELNYSYIETLDAGGKFSSKYKGEKVPKLEDYLELLKNADYIYPELKSYRNTDDIIKFTQTLVDWGFENKATIQTFSYPDTLPYIRQVSKRIKVAALCSNQQMFDQNLRIAKEDSNSEMSIPIRISNLDNLKKCRENKLDVSVWTIKNRNDFNRLLRMGYNKFICDIYIEVPKK